MTDRLTDEVVTKLAAMADGTAAPGLLSLAREVQEYRTRRCDGCASSRSWGADDEGVRCRLFSMSVCADHACNAWTPKEPTT